MSTDTRFVLVTGAILFAGSAATALPAQSRTQCAALQSTLQAAISSPDSTVVYATLQPARGVVPLPKWYLQAALTEIVSRFDGVGVHYDPLLDVQLPISVRPNGHAVATALLTSREVVIKSLGPTIHVERRTTIEVIGAGPGQVHIADVPPGPPDGARMMDSVRLMNSLMQTAAAETPHAAAPELYASPASVVSRLAAAVAIANADSAFPPSPDGTDTLSLVLQLRPSIAALPSPDSGAAVLPLFRTAGLHRTLARDAFFDGEVDVPARARRGDRPPEWPRTKTRSQGGALIGLVVDTTGRIDPASLQVLEAVPGFEENVLRAVRDWRFRPATIRGCPVRSTIDQAFLFLP